MGIYDRDYYRESRPGFAVRGPRTIVVTLILINVALFFANGLLTPPDLGAQPTSGVAMDEFFSKKMGLITYHLAVKGSSLTNPLRWWQFLTYGFAHSPSDYWHILGNMLVLFFLGRDVEARYGRNEFLRLYLVMLVVASLAFVVIERLQGAPGYVPVVGASGAVTGIVLLYALNFPRRTLLLYFVIPMPAWVLGLLVVLSDLYGALNPSSSHIAFTAHLAGAAFALLYYKFGWNFGRFSGGWLSLAWLRPRPNLRVRDPDREERQERELRKEVDRILEKIHRQGEASLTRKERRTLENASRQYQRKRDDPDEGHL